VQAIGELIDLGYRQDDAELIIEIVKKKEYDKTVTDLIKVIENDFKVGSITDIEAKRQLQELPITSAKRETIFQKWEQTKRVVQVRLSKDDIKQLLQGDVIGPFLAAEELYKLGYSQEQIRWLTLLWKPEVGQEYRPPAPG
jgi:hypothetical protein